MRNQRDRATNKHINLADIVKAEEYVGLVQSSIESTTGKIDNHIKQFYRIERYKKCLSRVPKDARLILDAGCGDGRFAEYFLKNISNGEVRLIGVDLSWPKISFAKCRGNKNKMNADFIVADVHNLPFKGESFNLIISLETLEHCLAPEIVLREFLRVVIRNKHEFEFLLTVPFTKKNNIECVHSLKDVYNIDNESLNIYHKEYKLDECIKLLNSNGIEVSGFEKISRKNSNVFTKLGPFVPNILIKMTYRILNVFSKSPYSVLYIGKASK
ncbi:MAG: class I SAM-dependent methyltransferase [bacterium]